MHEMSLEVMLSRPDLTILEVSAGMEHHPHGTCPMTLRQMDQLVGLQVGRGYFAALRSRFGGNRGCNHLHAMAQSIGTVVVLSFAAVHTYEHPAALELTPKEWFASVAENEPRVVNSCVIWHENGELVRQLTRNGDDHRATARHRGDTRGYRPVRRRERRLHPSAHDAAELVRGLYPGFALGMLAACHRPVGVTGGPGP